MALWLVRAGRFGEREQDALDKNVVVIGWDDWGNFKEYKTKDALKRAYIAKKPDASSNEAGSYVGQIWQFVNEINKGDFVVLPLKKQRAVAIGRIEGDYQYSKDDLLKHTRKVKWLKTLPRSQFDQDILYSFGSFRTVARITRNDAENRVKALADKKTTEPSAVKDASEEVPDVPDIEEIANDQLIIHLDRNFKGHKLAWLVDGILKAQGFTTLSSKPGPDGGVDILAASGAMGLDKPYICVQVKSSSSPVNSSVLRELMGVINKYKAEKGILVSLGGFNSSCLQEAKDAFFQIRLWGQNELLDEIFKNYDRLDDEIKAEIQLKKVWALVIEDEKKVVGEK